MINRRRFIETSTLLAGGMILPVGWHSWVARGVAQNIPDRKKLVVILLRGAVDGLNVVVPHQDPDYYEARPTIAIPYPGEPDGVIDLDGYFGLHPALADLMPLWKNKSLAFVHACGSPLETRSHFDAQDYLESGTPGEKSTPDGWMNRLLAYLPKKSPIQALNVGNTTPRILMGSMPVATIAPGKGSTRPLAVDHTRLGNAFKSLYAQSDALSKTYQEGVEAREILLTQLNQEMVSASRGAPLADQFVDDAKEVAQLIAGEAKTQLAFMAIGGWDTHINQKEFLNQSLKSLGKGLATLVKGLDSVYQDTVIMVMSEFGRTVKENGNGGTDHGHGNAVWLLGGSLQGGRMYGEWTGLAESVLYQGRDLPVTTDFREAIATVLTQHLQLPQSQLSKIFPDYQTTGSLSFWS